MLGETSPLLSSVPGVSHRFFSRIGGTSPRPWTGLNTSFDVMDSPPRVQENLARIRFQIGVSSGALFSVKQVHGNEIVEIKNQEDCSDVQADGLFTQLPNIALAIRTADCIPILMTDAQARIVVALHAGWRGAVADIMGVALQKIKEKTVIEAHEMIASMGPCIGPENFEVGEDVQLSAAKLQAVEPYFSPKGNGKYLFDLRAYVKARLNALGVEQVDAVGACTYADTETYFSHRSEEGQTGRQMSVIALCEPPDAYGEGEPMELPPLTL